MTSLEQRLKVTKKFTEWAKEKRIDIAPTTFLGYLELKGWLDVEKMLEDIEKERLQEEEQ
jgi:hypothetical protein